MDEGNVWKRCLPHKYLQRTCRWGTGLCVVVLLAAGIRLLVTITLLLTTYVLWTRKILFLFTAQAVLTFSMAMQLAAYVRLWKKRKRQTEASLTQGLQLLTAAHIGKAVWCMMMIGICWWIGSRPVLLSFYYQTLHITARDLILLGCLLSGWLLVYLFKDFSLCLIRKSMLGKRHPSLITLRLTSCAIILQYLWLVVFSAVILLGKTEWPVLLGTVPFLLLLFFYYLDAAGCYYNLSVRLIKYLGKERSHNVSIHP